MGKKYGPGVCNCKPLLGQPAPSPRTLICSICDFVAKTKAVFTTRVLSKPEMERSFKSVWGPEEREQYKYFLELMKPFEKEDLQAARTAYAKVERMRRDGTIEKTRALAKISAGA